MKCDCFASRRGRTPAPIRNFKNKARHASNFASRRGRTPAPIRNFKNKARHASNFTSRRGRIPALIHSFRLVLTRAVIARRNCWMDFRFKTAQNKIKK